MIPAPESRAAAKACGAKHYCTGKPCVNGHIARRFTSNGSCEQCATKQCVEWRAQNPGWAAEDSRNRRAANPEKVAASKKAARARNADKIKVQEHAYRQRNPEKRSALLRDWRERNVEQIAQYAKQYRAANKDRFRAYRSTAKAMRRAAEEAGISLGTLLGWTKEQPKVCFYCEVDCPDNYHVDHFMPLARGGAHVLTNLRIACAPCNQRKCAKDPAAWIESLAA